MKPLFSCLLVLMYCAGAFASRLDTAKSEKRFNKKELFDDIDYLLAATNEVHPNMYHSKLLEFVSKLSKGGLSGLAIICLAI